MKEPCPPLTKKKVMAAIPGTSGIKTRIAAKLNCDWSTLHYHLKDPAWADVVAAIEEEKNVIGEKAVNALADAIDQRIDIGASIRASTYVLSCRHGWREGSNVQIEGGKTPIEIKESGSLSADDIESLPLDLKMKVLEAVEATKAAKAKAEKP